MLQEFCKAVCVTLKNQGNVLVPTYPAGKIYDLIECLYRYLGDASLSNVPVYFISTMANQSLAYSNIFAEWLTDSRLNLVFNAESPFQHSDLVRNNFLKIYPNINAKFNENFQQPCIVFASHPSLRFGEACHFVDLWKNSPANSIIFTESEFNYLDALAPFQPIYANYFYFPIDTSLNGNQLNKILRETKVDLNLKFNLKFKIYFYLFF
jgi:integrator complex subunit 9